jgi:transcription initiation factor TFIIB
MKAFSNAGEWCCSICGFVSPSPVIDETSEYRQFALEHGVKNKPRAEFQGDDMVESLTTSVAYDGTQRARKLSLLNKRMTADQAQIRLTKHVKNIRKLGSQLGLEKSVSDRACKIFKEASEQNLTKTKKSEVIDAACVYHACKEKNVTKTMEAFVDLIACTKRELNSAIETISSLTSLQNVGAGWENLVRQYTPILRLPSFIEEAAVAVASIVNEIGKCQGKQPQGVSGACIALVVDMCPDPTIKRSLEDISKVVGLKKETVGQRLQEIQVMAPTFIRAPAVQEVMKHL